ncbi:hypothetical protein RRF57_008574 [Xylaria bambusicola]|uniref:Uncharacterized protein n=1 Tax=Xylaria bambusicola TaxID=326684 RepID=A0AAN7UI33_9PEZI
MPGAKPSSPELFREILEKSRIKYRALTSALQCEADIDPAFTAKVEREVGRVREAMNDLLTAEGVQAGGSDEREMI